MSTDATVAKVKVHTNRKIHYGRVTTKGVSTQQCSTTQIAYPMVQYLEYQYARPEPEVQQHYRKTQVQQEFLDFNRSNIFK